MTLILSLKIPQVSISRMSYESSLRQTSRAHLFQDFFEVSPDVLADYGAFNVACIVDLPLFIDPFLLFTSRKRETS